MIEDKQRRSFAETWVYEGEDRLTLWYNDPTSNKCEKYDTRETSDIGGMEYAGVQPEPQVQWREGVFGGGWVLGGRAPLNWTEWTHCRPEHTPVLPDLPQKT